MNSSGLLHPELIKNIPITGNYIHDKMLELVQNESSFSALGLAGVTIVVRTLNEADALEGLFEDIESQRVSIEPQVVVVDNESSDHTVQVAKSHGAEVVTIPRNEFTYPRSMNEGMVAADFDTVYLTVGHARLTNTQLISATDRSLINPALAGVFGRTLPSANVSVGESVLSVGSAAFMKKQKIKKAGIGVLGATSAAISKKVWDELGRFDERYQSGGEDTAMAQLMIDAGYEIHENPLLSVHHSHGLGLVDNIKQWIHWNRTVRGPVPLDMQQLARRRPDLKLKD